MTLVSGVAGTAWAFLLVAAGCRGGHTGATATADGGESGRCRDNAACAPDEYCAHASGLCGRAARLGTCQRKPSGCPHDFAPACGCDGKVYDSECMAHASGVDLAVAGRCDAVIPDWAACGRLYCDVHTSYCEIYLSDVVDPPTDYFCRPLPPSCLSDGGSPGCSCFPVGTPCLSFCGPLPTGGVEGFHLTCQGAKAPLH